MRAIWMQTEWGQLGLTNAYEMMHYDIYKIETPIAQPNMYGFVVCVCIKV